MSKPKRISARLSAATAEKLTRIIEATNSNMSEVLAQAIDRYFTEAVKRQAGGWKALEKSGFVGCAQGPADLSENYKNYLTESLSKKYDNRR